MPADTTSAPTIALHISATRTHINALPPEIILFIMKMGMSQTIRDERRITLARIPFDRGLSQICQHWRTIALSCPELWSVVPHPRSSTEWTELCLSRCSFGPIDFVIPPESSLSDAHCQQVIRLVLPHIARIRTVNLLSLDRHGDTNPAIGVPTAAVFLKLIIDSLTTQPAPLLEEVAMHSCSTGDGWDMPDHPLPIRLFFQQPPPRLWRVELRRCSISPPFSSIGSSLRHLELIDIHDWRNIDAIIQCLQATPILEHLLIHDLYTPWSLHANSFDNPRSSTHPIRCVPLQHLRTLDLNTTFPQNVAIFSHLKVPSTAKINVTHTLGDSLDFDFSDHLKMLAEAITEHFAFASSTELCFREIRVDMDSICATVLSQESELLVHLPSKFFFRLPVSLSYEPSEQSAEFLIACFSLPVFIRADRVEFDSTFSSLYPEAVQTLSLLRSQGSAARTPSPSL